MIDATGTPTQFIDTQRWRPSHLVFDKKDTLWVMGWQTAASAPSGEPEEYFLLRRFTKEGREDGRFLPRSQWPARPEPSSGGGGPWRISAAQDRIGFSIHSGYSSPEREVWLEWDLTGNQIASTATIGVDYGGRAYLANGHLIAQRFDDKGVAQLYYLDRVQKTWIPFGGAVASSCGSIEGADGNQLVCRARGTAQSLLRWIELPGLPALR